MNFRLFVVVLGAFLGINEIAHAQLKKNKGKQQIVGTTFGLCNDYLKGFLQVGTVVFGASASFFLVSASLGRYQNMQLNPCNQAERSKFDETNLMIDKDHVIGLFSASAMGICYLSYCLLKRLERD